MVAQYESGVCNIGPSERRLRYLGGGLGVMTAIGYLAVVIVLQWPPWTVVFTAIPTFGGIVGLYQGRAGFCVRYAISGVYNVGESVGDTDEVPLQRDIHRDRRQARHMLVRSAVLAVLVTIVVFVLATG